VSSEIVPIQTPVQAPRAKAVAERFAGSLRRELLDRILIVSQRHAAAVLHQYEHHYNDHRSHRTLGQAALPYDHPHRRGPPPRAAAALSVYELMCRSTYEVICR
jgi:hypothetical protein